jgi:hypothetical protein
MAFGESVGGERYNLRTGNTVPKKLSAAYIAAGAALWHLVKLNGNNDEVDRCVAGDVPYGFIFSLTGGINMCTVLRFRDNMLLAEYTGAVTVNTSFLVADGSGGTIKIGGFLRDRVKAGAGTALTVNKDDYATGVLLMENG